VQLPLLTCRYEYFTGLTCRQAVKATNLNLAALFVHHLLALYCCISSRQLAWAAAFSYVQPHF